MRNQILSAFPYFGGKAALTPVICDMLDYTECDTYIEPFGGGARVLLNKPRHPIEIYNDASVALCAFMRCMSKPETAHEVIARLYDTEYSQEEFYAALRVKNETEDDYFEELKRQFKYYLRELDRKYSDPQITEYIRQVRRNINTCREKMDFDPINNLIQSKCLSKSEEKILGQFLTDIETFLNLLSPIYHEEFPSVFYEVVNEYKDSMKAEITALEKSKDSKDGKRIAQLQKEIQLIEAGTPTKVIEKKINNECAHRTYNRAYLSAINNHDVALVDDVSLAVATWIVYTMSRDGIGTAFSSVKFKNQEEYHARISKLYEVAERMEGVDVSNVGALLYLKRFDWLNNPRICFYMDPSYLSPLDEHKNLGSVYKLSSEYEAHEALLKRIKNAKAKIIISNYDVPLYNKYLKAPTWKKYEFDTTTSVGGVSGNYRKEVIWKNFD